MSQHQCRCSPAVPVSLIAKTEAHTINHDPDVTNPMFDMTDDGRPQSPDVNRDVKDSSHNDLNCNCKQCARNGPYSCGNLPKTLF